MLTLLGQPIIITIKFIATWFYVSILHLSNLFVQPSNIAYVYGCLLAIAK